MPHKRFERFCMVFMQLTPYAQKTGPGILGIQGYSLSTNRHGSAIKAFAQVGAE